MDKETLRLVLEKHYKWVNKEEGGERANLKGANLKCAYLKGANLYGANLYGANLEGANLEHANLKGADLEHANLKGAYHLYGANLYGANLKGANLECAYLKGAYLYGANLEHANLKGANLEGANLEHANLKGAYLYGANLYGANLYGAYLPDFQIVPQEGGFYAYKKTTKGVIKIHIPSNSKRTSSLIGRKCRAEYVRVVGGEGCGGTSPTHGALVYNKGGIVRADKFDDDIRVECTHGIHFFMTKKEAEEY